MAPGLSSGAGKAKFNCPDLADTDGDRQSGRPGENDRDDTAPLPPINPCGNKYKVVGLA